MVFIIFKRATDKMIVKDNRAELAEDLFPFHLQRATMENLKPMKINHHINENYEFDLSSHFAYLQYKRWSRRT